MLGEISHLEAIWEKISGIDKIPLELYMDCLGGTSAIDIQLPLTIRE